MQLSLKQWTSLFTLTSGCLVHVVGLDDEDDDKETVIEYGHFIIGSLFIITQIVCSVFAGVYTEFIIKGKGADIPIMMQNVFMYLDSILCNILLLGLKVQHNILLEKFLTIN